MIMNLVITDPENISFIKCYERMGLLPDTQNCELRMRRQCRERFYPPTTSKETAS